MPKQNVLEDTSLNKWLYQGKHRQTLEEDLKEVEKEVEMEQNPDGQPPSEPPLDGAAQEPPKNPEEETFKKRYGDLRRFHDQTTKELKDKLHAVESKLKEVVTGPRFPKTMEEVEKWSKEYPDLYALVKTISRKEAQDEHDDVNKKMEALMEKEQQLLQERAYAELIKRHPDFEDLRQDKEFHDWLSTRSEEVRSWLYDNNTDASKASDAIDLYKAYKIKSDAVTRKPKTPVEAAAPVGTRGNTQPPSSDKPTYKTSDIAKMSARDYEKHEAKIMEAYYDGRVIDE